MLSHVSPRHSKCSAAGGAVSTALERLPNLLPPAAARRRALADMLEDEHHRDPGKPDAPPHSARRNQSAWTGPSRPSCPGIPRRPHFPSLRRKAQVNGSPPQRRLKVASGRVGVSSETLSLRRLRASLTPTHPVPFAAERGRSEVARSRLQAPAEQGGGRNAVRCTAVHTGSASFAFRAFLLRACPFLGAVVSEAACKESPARAPEP